MCVPVYVCVCVCVCVYVYVRLCVSGSRVWCVSCYSQRFIPSYLPKLFLSTFTVVTFVYLNHNDYYYTNRNDYYDCYDFSEIFI